MSTRIAALALLLALGGVARADVTRYVRKMIDQGDWKAARGIIDDANAHGESSLAVVLEARSWLARGELAAHKLDEALADARAVHKLVVEDLESDTLANPQLATALGAAIEVEAQALAEQGERPRAIELTRAELARYGKTPIAMRLQKNLNLLTMQGVAAPALEREPHFGAAAPTLASLAGKPVLLFFWAHWCPDCKAMAPDVAKLAEELAPAGLKLIAPTQTYGASMAEVDAVRRSAYAALGDAPVPVSDANFARYGASSMPTIVVIDRAGKVALYHPGKMTYAELKPILAAAVRKREAQLH